MWDMLSAEILGDIILRLPAEHLFHCRAVSKEWRRLIDDPSFIKSHSNNNNQLTSNTLLIRDLEGTPICLLPLETLNLNVGNRQSIDGTPVQNLIRPGVPRDHDAPVASCNCLMLVSDLKCKMIWAIWNPLTNDCHELPPHPDAGAGGLSLMGKGLGYDHVSGHYKVVIIDIVVRDALRVCRTLVYSMKSGSWRIVKDCPRRFLGSPEEVFNNGSVHLYSGTMGTLEGVFINGAVHWLANDFIIAFDMGTEDYRQLALPRSCPSFCKLAEMWLVAMGGCLVLSYSYRTIERFDGWIMNDYGVEQSWKKLLSLGKGDIGEQDIDMSSTLQRLRPVAYLNGKRQVLLQHYSGFFAVDVECGSVKNVTIHSQRISNAQIFPGSLLRLGDSGRAAANATFGVKRIKRRKKKLVTRTCSLNFCIRGVNEGYCSDHNCRLSDEED